MVRLAGPMDVAQTPLQVTRRVIQPVVDQSGARLADIGTRVGAVMLHARDQQIQTEVIDTELQTRKQLDDLRVSLGNQPPDTDLRAMWDQGSQAIVQANSAAMTSPMHQRLWHERMGVLMQQQGEQVTALQQQRYVETRRAGVLTTIGASNVILANEDSTQTQRDDANAAALASIATGLHNGILGADDAARLTVEQNAKTLAANSDAQLRDLHRMVESDPHGAVAMLAGVIEHPETKPASMALVSQDNQLALLHQAQAEVHRQQAEARAAQAQAVASLRDTLNAQIENMQATNVMPSQPLDLDVIARTLGPDVAQRYGRVLEAAAAGTAFPSMSMQDVAAFRVAPVVSGHGTDYDRLMTATNAAAANTDLRARNEDPGGYALTNGLMRGSGMMAQIQRGDMGAVRDALAVRSVDAVNLRQTGQLPRVAPLSNDEATALTQWLAQQPAQAQLQFFGSAANRMNHDAYNAMMVQLAPDGGDTLAYAGYRFNDNPETARRLLNGAQLLAGGPPGQDRQRQQLVQMPSENDLQRKWIDMTTGVGRGNTRVSAYAGIRGEGAEAAAYAAFRAYYADRVHATGGGGSTPQIVNQNIAVEAMNAATGGIVPWAGRQTLMPAGMSAADFRASVGHAFQQVPQLSSLHPGDYQLTAIGQGHYIVEGLRVGGNPAEIVIQRGPPQQRTRGHPQQ